MIDIEKHLRETQRLTLVASWEWDLSNDKLAWSDEHYRIFGVEPETFTPTFEAALKLIHPDDVPAVQSVITRARTSGGRLCCAFRVVRPDGVIRHVVTRIACAKSRSDTPPSVYGTLQDVTEAKLCEADLLRANRRAQALSAQILEVQETERRRIANELHDGIGQTLTAVQIALHRVRRRTRSKGVLSGIDDCTAITCSAIEQVRGLAINLRPPHLDDLGLEATIAWLLEQQSTVPGLKGTFDARSVPRSLPPEIEIACFRVAQEALVNVLKHARATRVAVELRYEEDVLHLGVEDDGVGFDIEAAHSRAIAGTSVGLLSMEERALLAGGRLTIQPVSTGGTRISVSFPLASVPEREAPVPE